MRKTRGKADPAALTKLIQKKLRLKKSPSPPSFPSGGSGDFVFLLPYFIVMYVEKNISVGVTGMFWILLL